MLSHKKNKKRKIVQNINNVVNQPKEKTMV